MIDPASVTDENQKTIPIPASMTDNNIVNVESTPIGEIGGTTSNLIGAGIGASIGASISD